MISHSEKMKTCDSCEFNFVSNDGLKKHKEVSHSRMEEIDHSGECCDECNLYFNDTDELRNHIRNQHGAEVNPAESEEVTLDENPEESIMTDKLYFIPDMVDSIIDDIVLLVGNKDGNEDENKDVWENEDQENETETEKDKSEGTDQCGQDTANEANELNTAISAKDGYLYDEDHENELEKDKSEGTDQCVQDSANEANELNAATSPKDGYLDDNKQSNIVNSDGESVSSDSNDDEEEEEEICYMKEEMQRIKNENNLLKLKVNKLQDERLTQDIRRIKLEDEKHALEETITNGFKQYDALLKEFEKTKKNKKREEKELENKIAAINKELVKSYSKVDKIYKENVKLLEEKKVLEGIHKVNTEIHEKLKEAERKLKESNVQEVNGEDEDKCDELEETEEDEEIEMMSFFMNQRENRSSRTSPASNAENPNTKKATKARVRFAFACNECNFTADTEELFKKHMIVHSYTCEHCKECFKTKGLHRRHLKEVHNIFREQETQDKDKREEPVKNNTQSGSDKLKCKKCDFQGNSEVQMEKHETVRHRSTKVCHFWQQGVCNKAEKCLFSHQMQSPQSQPPPSRPPPCRNGIFCRFWPQCKFSHSDTKFCRYQTACKNQFCTFVHMNQEAQPFLEQGRQSQYQRNISTPPPMWRPL